jgi:general secretion pathway protein K
MRRQRGVALLIALVVVALATILATRIGTDSALNQRRAGYLFVHEQAMQVALGAEVWAQEVLAQQFNQPPSHISLDQAWATPLPPLPIDGGTIVGALEDMQGRFNLNNLIDPKTGGKSADTQIYFDQFQRLLASLQLEPKWASLLLDWIDFDNLATLPDGAEDGEYMSQVPPYLAANLPITSTSELLSLPGFGIERYRKLAPYVSALPVGTPLNLCTAPGLVLASLSANMGYDFSRGTEQLTNNRQQGCFPTPTDLQKDMASAPQDFAAYQKAGYLGQTSKYFRSTVIVSIGTTEFSLYTLFNVNAQFPRPVLRSIGTE